MTRWHPEVGKTQAPDLKNIRHQIDDQNKTFVPSKGDITVFKDVEYSKMVKEMKVSFTFEAVKNFKIHYSEEHESAF